MDIRIITQGGVLGNRVTRRGGGGRVQNARAGPSRFSSFVKWVLIPCPPTPYIKQRGAIIVTPDH